MDSLRPSKYIKKYTKSIYKNALKNKEETKKDTNATVVALLKAVENLEIGFAVKLFFSIIKIDAKSSNSPIIP